MQPKAVMEMRVVNCPLQLAIQALEVTWPSLTEHTVGMAGTPQQYVALPARSGEWSISINVLARPCFVV